MNELSKYFENGFSQPENLEDDEYTLLPAGWYPVEITGVEIVENKNGSGARFVVEFTIIGDSYANRKVWNGAGFNFIHTSQKCQNIGQRELGRLTKACGYGENDRLKDENELLNRRLDVYVEVEPGTEGYKDKNVTTKYKPLGQGGNKKEKMTTVYPKEAPENPMSESSSAPQEASAPEKPVSSSTNKRPWER